MLHWLLTGERPFRGTTLPQLAAAHALGPRPVPSAAREGLPPGYDAVVAHLTAVEPSDRPADGAALAAVLEDLARGRVVTPAPARAGPAGNGPPHAPPGAPRRGARPRRHVPVAVGLAVTLTTAAVLLLDGDGQGAAAPVQREVCARELTLRDQPVKGSATLDTVPGGGTLLVVGTRGAWSQVRRDDGGQAWVLTEFLCP